MRTPHAQHAADVLGRTLDRLGRRAGVERKGQLPACRAGGLCHFEPATPPATPPAPPGPWECCSKCGASWRRPEGAP